MANDAVTPPVATAVADGKIEVVEGDSCWGGVVGYSADGRISVDNRVECRLVVAQERLAGSVAHQLVGANDHGR